MKNTNRHSTLTTTLLAAAISLTCFKARAQEEPIPYDMIGIVRCPALVAQYGEKRSGIGDLEAPVPNDKVFIRQVDNILADDNYTDVSGPTVFVEESTHRFTMIFSEMIPLDRHRFLGNDDDYYLMHGGPKSYFQIGAAILNADTSDFTLKRPIAIIKHGINPLTQIQNEINHLPHNQSCERPDRFDNPVCITYNKNVEILTKRQDDIRESMSKATKLAKEGLQDMLVRINQCATNWATLHQLKF